MGTAALYAVINTGDDSVTYLTSSDDASARPHAISPTLDGDRLYIAHDTGNQVTAIDTATGSVDFTITGIPRAEESIPSRFGDLLWVSARGDNTVKRIDLASHSVTSVAIGAQPESIMLTPNELTLVVSLRGSPASLGFVDTLTLTSLGLVQIGPAGSAGDLAVMTTNGHHVFATYDNGIAGTGGIAVVDVRTREVMDTWAYRNRPAARVYWCAGGSEVRLSTTRSGGDPRSDRPETMIAGTNLTTVHAISRERPRRLTIAFRPCIVALIGARGSPNEVVHDHGSRAGHGRGSTRQISDRAVRVRSDVVVATSGVGNWTPTNENPPEHGGAVPRLLPFAPAAIDADPFGPRPKDDSKPVERRRSGTATNRLLGLSPMAPNVLTGLNALNSTSYAGLMNAKSLSLTLRPLPSVEKTTPRARGLKF